MSLVCNKDFDPMFDLVQMYFDARQNVQATANIKNNSRIHSEYVGRANAIADAVSLLLTRSRGDRFPKLWEKWIPSFLTEEIQTLLDPLSDAWKQASDRNGRAAVTKEAMTKLNDLIDPDGKYSIEERGRHRTAVLNGEEEPFEEDREWLMTELKQREQFTRRLQELLNLARRV